MKVKLFFIFFCMCLVIGTHSPADALLSIQGTGQIWDVVNDVALSGDINLIYDSDQNITWLDNFENEGMATWSLMNGLAENLTLKVGDTLYDEWRLPSTPAFSEDISELDPAASELGYLYHYGLSGIDPKYGVNVGPFSEISENDPYVLGREIGLEGDGWIHYYAFSFRTGEHVEWRSSEDCNWMAVHDGQIGAAISVPEPSALLLISSGFMAICVFRKKLRSRYS
jgi:hypothetical protein